MRPLYDDGTKNVSKITRDYVLRVDGDASKAPLLSIFGGKITTYRKLAEHALEKLNNWFPNMQPSWTADTQLPGGTLAGNSLEQYIAWLTAERSHLPPTLLRALALRHGDQAPMVIGEAQSPADLGEHFGHTLYAREVDHFMRHEWARNADDILWRRSKCGLHLNVLQKQRLEEYVTKHLVSCVR